MKRLLGLMTGFGLSLALVAAAHADSLHIGIHIGGPPVLVPTAPPAVVVPPPRPVIVAPPLVYYRAYYPAPVMVYPHPYVVYPTPPYYVAGPAYGYGHPHKHWKRKW